MKRSSLGLAASTKRPAPYRHAADFWIEVEPEVGPLVPVNKPGAPRRFATPQIAATMDWIAQITSKREAP
jgi:hypothetical protein